MKQAQEDWATVKQVAIELGVTTRTVWSHVSAGRIPASRIDYRHTLVPRAWIEVAGRHCVEGEWSGGIAKYRWDEARAEFEAAQ